MLGTPSRKSNWRVNTGVDRDNQKVISDQSMPNTHVRKFLDHFEELSVLCVIDEEQLEVWNEVISLWINLMEFARKRSDFTEEEIVDFQDRTALFLVLLISRTKTKTGRFGGLLSNHYGPGSQEGQVIGESSLSLHDFSAFWDRAAKLRHIMDITKDIFDTFSESSCPMVKDVGTAFIMIVKEIPIAAKKRF